MNIQFNRFLFWAMAIWPVGVMWIIISSHSSFWFTVSVLIYALIYRPVLNIVRLLTLGKIDKHSAWKLFISFYQNKFAKSLWLK